MTHSRTPEFSVTPLLEPHIYQLKYLIHNTVTDTEVPRFVSLLHLFCISKSSIEIAWHQIQHAVITDVKLAPIQEEVYNPLNVCPSTTVV
jgi:hypothetical protein